MESRPQRKNDPVGLRNRMLDVAAASFQANGFAATSTHDIVRAAKVTGGALHHHFPTKKSLALAVIAERVAAEVASTWIETVHGAPTAAAGIVEVFDMVAAALDHRGAVTGCPLGNLALELSLADEEMRAAVVSEYAVWRDAVADRVRADVDAGRARFAADDPLAFATFVVALFTGAMTVAKAEQATAALSACTAQLKTIMRADL